jgi:hypothetical protein
MSDDLTNSGSEEDNDNDEKKRKILFLEKIYFS